MTALTKIVPLVLLAGLLQSAAADAQQGSDDNGEISFIRQTIPKLFGRKPKGALEVQLLLDLDTQLGRAAVVRSLMQNGEFVDHWTDVIVDQLRMQREGDRAQTQACFGAPLQSTGAATSALAAFVRDQPPGTTTAPPGGVFNMIDLIRSAIVLDDLSPIYRAYPVPLTLRVNNMAPETSVGDAFNHTLLNRELDCLGCHSSTFSTTGAGSMWNRTWPAPVNAEVSVYGPSFASTQQTRDQTYAVFRIDQIYADLYSSPMPTIQPAAVAPWGITPACGQILMNLSALPARTTHFANQSGNQIGLIDLAVSFKSGSDALKSSGLQLIPVANSLPMVPGDQGYAYLVAEAVTESVWKELLGSRLTIANYFPRNEAQRDTLMELTNAVFNAEHWSLKGLITATLTGSGQFVGGYFNRKAPDIDPNSPAYRIPMKFDPWVQKDPRLPDPMPDPADHNNGQGELVHRNSPRSLLHSVAAALGWPEPQRFPGSNYPSMQLEKAMGQFISDDEQGRDGVDFQGLLSWEAQFGVCSKQLAGVTGDDWIDRLVAGIPAFDAANPGSPLTAGDLVAVLKDWLTGDAAIANNTPTPLDPAHPPLSEADALTALFGVALTTQASSVSNLAPKLRRVCGAVLESPQFMLAGVQSTTSLTPPRLRICNSTGACTYQEMCQSLIHPAGFLALCNANSISLTPIPDLKCPKNLCTKFSSPGITFCERVPGACGFPGYLPSFPIGVPPIECPICVKPWVDLTEPTGFFVDVPRAVVLTATGADFRPYGATDFRPLPMGATLYPGAMIRLRGGSTLRLSSTDGVISTPRGRMPGKNDSLLTAADRAVFEGVQSGNPETLLVLIKKGAHVNARDRFGQTPLMMAAARDDVGMLRVLLTHGADLAREDPRGLNAADFAALGRGKEALLYLKRLGLTAKPWRELQHAGPAVEEPWYIFVGRRPARRHPSAGTKVLGQTPKQPARTPDQYLSYLQRHWAADRRRSRGEAGPVLTQTQAREALANYMKNNFAKEHPAAIK